MSRLTRFKSDGKRVTFNPQQVDETKISGTSEVLGPCHFEIAGVDQILFGLVIDTGLFHEQGRNPRSYAVGSAPLCRTEARHSCELHLPGRR